MTSNIIHCEIIASDLIQPRTTIQIDEEHNVIYALTNYKLTRIDLNKTNDHIQLVYQHNRKFQEINTDDDDENYSQGESDEEISRVSDPYEDSEPSTDDDEEKIENRRNWRRHGWSTYQLDNPCVITFLTIELEDNRPFVQGSSKNIFCFDFNVFNNSEKKQSIQPWSIASTSTIGLFVFSLLDSSQIYTLDTRNENTIIQQLITTSVNNPQILAVSSDDGTTIKVDLPFIEQGKIISTMTIDKTGHIYILSDSIVFKCTWQSQLQLVECLGKIDVLLDEPHMAVTHQGNQFYFSDTQMGCLYRWRKINT